MNKKFENIAKDVINLEIKALQKLKKNINSSFGKAVKEIAAYTHPKICHIFLLPLSGE